MPCNYIALAIRIFYLFGATKSPLLPSSPAFVGVLVRASSATRLINITAPEGNGLTMPSGAAALGFDDMS